MEHRKVPVFGEVPVFYKMFRKKIPVKDISNLERINWKNSIVKLFEQDFSYL